MKIIPIVQKIAELKKWPNISKALFSEFSKLGSKKSLVVEIHKNGSIKSFTVNKDVISTSTTSVLSGKYKADFNIDLKNNQKLLISNFPKCEFSPEEHQLLSASFRQTAALSETISKVTKVSRKAWNKIRSPMLDEKIIAVSKSMQESLTQAKVVSNFDTNVILSGESGCGKELLANFIHENSKRSSKTFLKINCAAIPSTLVESTLFGHEKGAFTGAQHIKKGYFERAHKGTLFLDEIAELDMALQAKLLRVLESQEFERVGGDQTFKSDVRIICASHKNLEEEITKGNFRSDLFYRIATFPILISPLRERKEDTLPLAYKILKDLSRKLDLEYLEISEHFESKLLSHTWPGNGRELRNEMERSLFFAKISP